MNNTYGVSCLKHTSFDFLWIILFYFGIYVIGKILFIIIEVFYNIFSKYLDKKSIKDYIIIRLHYNKQKICHFSLNILNFEKYNNYNISSFSEFTTFLFHRKISQSMYFVILIILYFFLFAFVSSKILNLIKCITGNDIYNEYLSVITFIIGSRSNLISNTLSGLVLMTSGQIKIGFVYRIYLNRIKRDGSIYKIVGFSSGYFEAIDLSDIVSENIKQIKSSVSNVRDKVKIEVKKLPEKIIIPASLINQGMVSEFFLNPIYKDYSVS